MLDVFCCALGCVTLLWLLNTRQATDQAAAARTALQDLFTTRSSLEATQSERETLRNDLSATRTERDAIQKNLDAEVQKRLAELQKLNNQLASAKAEQEQVRRTLAAAEADTKAVRESLENAKKSLSETEKERDTARQTLAAVEKERDAKNRDLTATATAKKEAEDSLRKMQADTEALAKKVEGLTASSADLDKLLRKKEEERAAANRLASELRTKLDDLDAKLRAARKDVDAATAAAKASTAKSLTDMTAAAGQVKDLEKKLADANAMIVDLQGEKAKLADKFDKMQRDTENKFAGVALTGKRVVFLVDKSGSMDRTSEQVLAPSKWPTVAETIAKVMRSIPELEQFQVIVFSKDARWLFGQGEWQKFEGEKTVAAVKETLLRVKVEGDTNLYNAFDLTFTLRDHGLDTVYLFSDGLPTTGPGLSDAQLRQNPPLKFTEQSEILSQYVRIKLATSWNRAFTNQPKVKINAVGFFYESPDLGAFLWALSRENDGSFVGMSKP